MKAFLAILGVLGAVLAWVWRWLSARALDRERQRAVEQARRDEQAADDAAAGRYREAVHEADTRRDTARKQGALGFANAWLRRKP